MRLFGVLLVLQFVLLYSSLSAQENVTIEEICVLGNKKTKTSIILREMTLQIGMDLPESQLEREIERSKNNIINSNLFVYVNMDYERDQNFIRINVEVKERLYLLPLPIIYLADRSFNEWWYNRDRDLKRVIYGVQLNHSNLSGNADVLKFKAYGGFVPYFELSYARPYINRKQSIGLKGGVFYSSQKSFAYRTDIDKLDFFDSENRNLWRKGAFVQYNLRNRLYHFHEIYLGYTDLKISPDIALANPNFIGEGNDRLKYLTFKYDYRWDKRDNIQYPLQGHALFVGLTNFGMGVNKKVSHTRLNASYFQHLTLSKNWYISGILRSQLSAPRRQLYHFTNGLGYGNYYVRGYELNVIDGQHFIIEQMDLKYKIFKNIIPLSKFLRIDQLNSLPLAIYSRIFFDVGYIRNFHPELSRSELANRTLYGGGFGLDFITFYDTAAKVNFSLNQFGQKQFFFGIYRSL